MAIQGATVTVAAGATSATVAGAFAAAYQVGLSASWATDFQVSAKTAAGFTITFSVPAPPSGGTFDWVVNSSTVPTSSAISGASAAVSAGATSLAVVTAAALPSAYQVTVEASWLTGFSVTGKTALGFTITFTVPAPPGGGTVDWIAFGPAIGTVTLADELDELRRLLHDPNDRYWSAVDKAFYLNRARQRRDLDTAANRQVLSFTLTAGTGTYTVTQIGNAQIFDIINLIVIVGNTRVILQQLSLTELNIKFRPWTTLQSQPWGFAKVGPSQVILGPTPGIAYATEVDCCVYSAPLVLSTDTDPLPYPYTQPVPFYAAYLAKINERQDDEASEFLDRYQMLVSVATNSRMGRVPNAYTGVGIGR